MPGGAIMNTGNVRAAALAAAVITMLAGCAAAPRDAGLAALTKTGEWNVTVAAIPSADLAGLYIAQDEGLFARQGLHVTITTIASTKAVIASQLNGQVDIGAGSYVGYVAAQAAGARFRILAEASTLRPHTRVLVTTAGSRITTLAGLVGKKIAVNGTGSIGTLLISTLFAENGIAPAKVRFVTDKQGFPDMARQLQRGQWDAAFLAEPYASTWAVHISGAARVDGRLISAALRRAAGRNGATVLPGDAALRCAHGAVEGVTVADQFLAADAVVAATGAWTDAFVEPAGLTLGVTAQRGQIVHIGLGMTDTSRWPAILPSDTGHYMLAFDDSRVVAGATRETGSGFDYRITPGGLAEVLDEALAVAPGLASGTYLETRIGFRPMGPDIRPLLGTVPGIDGLLLPICS